MTNLIDRILPQDISTEVTILGSMTTSNATAAKCIDLLDEDCFYSSPNRYIFRTMKEMFIENKPLELMLISTELKNKGILESVGDDIYLSELSENIVTEKNIGHYCEILVEMALRRRNINVCMKTAERLFSDFESKGADISSEAVSSLIQAESKQSGQIVRMGQALPEFFDHVEKVLSGKRSASDIVTGYPSIDKMLFIKNGDLVVFGGRPSQGKSSVASCLVRNISIGGKVCAVFNLESSTSNEVQRAMFSQSRVSLHQFNSRQLPKRDMPKLSMSAGVLADAPIYYDGYSGNTPAKMYSSCLQIKNMAGALDLIVVDFLQIVNPDRRYESRRVEIGALCKQIGDLGKRFNVPVFLLSQLTRPTRGNIEAPTMADLKESGDIEQNAETVILLHREEYYMKQRAALEAGKVNCIDFIVAKNKNGPTGTIDMAYIKEFMRLEELAKQEEEDNGWEDRY